VDDYGRALLRLLEVPSSPRLGLARMEALLAALGDPQRSFRALHIAGTNGKGSTAAFADALLGAAGLSRGRTTSPHLVSATERIVIEGAPISPARFVELEARVHTAAARLDDAPTFFERVIAMSFCAFADAGVPWAVVEVGLGGRLDATGTVDAAACAITPIALDHQRFLGDTLEAIAREKGGIFRAGVPAVSARQAEEARRALEEVAEEVGAPLRALEDADRLALGGAELPLFGEHQRENAALAVALVRAAGIELSAAQAEAGLAATRWPGRFERVSEAPPVILDGAHNAAAARALVAAAKAAGQGPWCVVLGFTRGHEGAAFSEALAQLAPQAVWATKARAPRSIRADEARACAEAGGLPVQGALDLDEALAQASAHARAAGGQVLVTGSLYLVGEARGRYREQREDPELPDF
jgi:dihydrofolate synthase/folylpolyglutamate synthase